MKWKSFKNLFFLSLLMLGGNMSLLQATGIYLPVDLKHAVQTIPTVIFALPRSDGSWTPEGQVRVTSNIPQHTVYISGMLVTNYEAGNDISKGNTASGFSLLGGSNNTMTNAQESTLIGGKHNKISSPQSFIVGGEGNSILGTSYRSTILGGKNSQIQGESSTLIGGNASSIQGNNSTLIGENNRIVGNNAFTAGNGANVTADGSFAWSDGTVFSVSQSNFFAIQGNKGVVVGKNIPHAATKLTLNGGFRIQKNDTKNPQISCKKETIGVIKSVAGSSNANQLCSCVCDGTNWKAVVATPQCLKACGDPRNESLTDPACGTTYRTCTKGVLLPHKSYVYGGDSSTLNTWYWTCQNPNTSKTTLSTCKVEFRCTGTTPAKAQLCPYSATDATKKDARELRQNVAKTLTGVPIAKCPNTPANPNTQSQAINCTNTPNNQTSKCQYYCISGYHLEGTTCVPNDCGAKKEQDANGYTYNVPCVTHGANSPELTSEPVMIANGTRTYKTRFTCQEGIFKPYGTTTAGGISCNNGYHTENQSTCVPNTRTASCNGSMPGNAQANGAATYTQVWNNGWSSKYWSYGAGECKYTCRSRYTWNGSSCIDCSSYTLNSCPANGNCSNCANGKYSLNSCKSGYHRVGSSCVEDNYRYRYRERVGTTAWSCDQYDQDDYNNCKNENDGRQCASVGQYLAGCWIKVGCKNIKTNATKFVETRWYGAFWDTRNYITNTLAECQALKFDCSNTYKQYFNQNLEVPLSTQCNADGTTTWFW